MRKTLTLGLLAGSLFMSKAALAHFQLIYTPEININKSGDVPLKLIFWHPMENGHVMKMEQPQEFYSVFRGQKTDLSSSLKPFTFKGRENSNEAYEGSVNLKRNGDYALVVVPTPYYEENEDIYIQQISKTYINKGDIPSDWNTPLGLKTEIVPLNKPYGVLAGSTFSGVVLADGKPVPYTEIEIEYLVAEPNMASNSVSSDKTASIPGGALAISTDHEGRFTFGIPKAGFWGFAALGSGPDKEHKGKELSQDAILWIKAHEMGE